MRSASDLTARARIRDAALARFGAEGFERTGVRAIAADAGVSPALVLHHFGSKVGLRRACDEHVLRQVREGSFASSVSAAPSELGAKLDASEDVRRYLARAIIDGTGEAAALYDALVEVTLHSLGEGEREGLVRPTADPRARAAVFLAWQLASVAFRDHLSRALGGDVLGTVGAVRWSRASLEIYTHGLFTDARLLGAYEELEQRKDGPEREET